MTEAEWLKRTQPKKMLAEVRGKYSTRKMMLFSCASCRRVWSPIQNSWSSHAVETAERYADGLASEEELDRAREGAVGAARSSVNDTAAKRASAAAFAAIADSAFTVNDILLSNKGIGERQRQALLLTDIFGNPFSPLSLDPTCLSPTVASLAQAAYDDRILPSGELDLDRLAVLSDALEEAGCDESAVLDHLRDPGPHVRGCWVVDLLLGKT